MLPSWLGGALPTRPLAPPKVTAPGERKAPKGVENLLCLPPFLLLLCLLLLVLLAPSPEGPPAPKNRFVLLPTLTNPPLVAR